MLILKSKHSYAWKTFVAMINYINFKVLEELTRKIFQHHFFFNVELSSYSGSLNWKDIDA